MSIVYTARDSGDDTAAIITRVTEHIRQGTGELERDNILAQLVQINRGYRAIMSELAELRALVNQLIVSLPRMLANAREEGRADGFVAGAAASNSRHDGNVRPLRHPETS